MRKYIITLAALIGIMLITSLFIKENGLYLAGYISFQIIIAITLTATLEKLTKKKWKWYTVTAVIVSALVIMQVILASGDITRRSNVARNLAENVYTLTSNNSKVQIVVPSTVVNDKDIDSLYIIKASDKKNEIYVQVAEIKTGDIAPYTFDTFCDKIIKKAVMGFKSCSQSVIENSSNRKTIEIFGSKNISDEFGNKEVVSKVFISFIEKNDDIFCCMTYSIMPNLNYNSDVLKNIAVSFAAK